VCNASKGNSGVSLSADFVIYTIFTSNFIGVVFARSLHYQFYCWYFHMIPYMLCKSSVHGAMAIAIMGGIEYAFNVYPASAVSSVILQVFYCFIFYTSILNQICLDLSFLFVTCSICC
jgi:alpha-1,3-mannosyltransferase